MSWRLTDHYKVLALETLSRNLVVWSFCLTSPCEAAIETIILVWAHKYIITHTLMLLQCFIMTGFLLLLPFLYSFVMCAVVFPKLFAQTACPLMHVGHLIEVTLASFCVCLVVCVYGIKLLWNKHSNLPMATERAKHHYTDTENTYIHYCNEYELNSQYEFASQLAYTTTQYSYCYWGVFLVTDRKQEYYEHLLMLTLSVIIQLIMMWFSDRLLFFAHMRRHCLLYLIRRSEYELLCE